MTLNTNVSGNTKINGWTLIQDAHTDDLEYVYFLIIAEMKM